VWEVINGGQSVLHAGYAWRLMPDDLPHGQTADQAVHAWRPHDTWRRLHEPRLTEVSTRQRLVETTCLLWCVLVHAADRRDAGMAPWPLAIVDGHCERLHTWVEEPYDWPVEIVERPRLWGWYPIDVEPPPMPAFTVVPRRWVVNCTLALPGRDRRLSHNDADLPERRETMIDWALRWLMLSRLSHQAPYGVSAHSEGLQKAATCFLNSL
jgi:hypothetical protein